MIDLNGTHTVPLIWSEDRTIRVTGLRVTLDSIVGEFKRGSTVECCCEHELANRVLYLPL